MDKNDQRRFKAKLALMDCDLSAARKMVYALEDYTVEGFRKHMTELHKTSEEVLQLIPEEVQS
jgi:hypothetical protein